MCYNKETLSKMRIYELRDLGREKGVRSPTSLKKQELVEKILEITCGEAEPYRTNRGRPAINYPAPTDSKGLSIDINMCKTVSDKERIVDELLAKLKEDLLKLL